MHSASWMGRDLRAALAELHPSFALPGSTLRRPFVFMTINDNHCDSHRLPKQYAFCDQHCEGLHQPYAPRGSSSTGCQ